MDKAKTKCAEGAVVAHPLFQEEGGGSNPTSALQLKIYEIDMWLASELNRRWHSMLPRTDVGNLLCGNVSVAYAAEFSGRWFSVAIYSQPIIASMCERDSEGDDTVIELRRLAICKDCPKNTASRMLSITRKMIRKRYPKVKKAISYLAVDVHQGTIYKASGWSPVGEIVAARPQRFSGSKQRSTGPLQTTSRKQRWEISI